FESRRPETVGGLGVLLSFQVGEVERHDDRSWLRPAGRGRAATGRFGHSHRGAGSAAGVAVVGKVTVKVWASVPSSLTTKPPPRKATVEASIRKLEPAAGWVRILPQRQNPVTVMVDPLSAGAAVTAMVSSWAPAVTALVNRSDTVMKIRVRSRGWS